MSRLADAGAWEALARAAYKNTREALSSNARGQWLGCEAIKGGRSGGKGSAVISLQRAGGTAFHEEFG